jgi:hypothetical protein
VARVPPGPPSQSDLLGPPGQAVIHPLELVRMAIRTAKVEPGRVFLPALVIFGLEAFGNTAFTELSADHLGVESLAGFVVLMLSTLGLTFYSGLLERLVGAVERGLPTPAVHRVLRQLPYVQLLMADGILWVLNAVASFALVIPGIIVTTLFALIGPVITTHDTTVRDAFRRSARLVSPHFILVLCLVTLPLAVEHEVVDTVALLVSRENLGLVYLSNAVMGLAFGVALGLVEVSLAEWLLHGARGPGRECEPGTESEPGSESEPGKSEPGKEIRSAVTTDEGGLHG